MMSFGSFGNGGSSSSSSNLSALAPPFTVDRSNPKPNSNPLMTFTERPYAVPFHSSFHSWQYPHSSASRPNLYSNLDSEVDSIRTTCQPSDDDYRHLGSHSDSSPSTHMPPLNLNVSAATDTFTFLQYSNDIPNKSVEAKPYYPPFVSPVVDDDIPSVALNAPGFELLSTSCVAPLDGSSQVGYTQSLSGLEYVPQWGSFWTRLADEEQGKRVELDGGFCSEETNNAGSYVYKNYVKQGAGTVEGLSKCEEASTFPHRKWVDILGREKHIVSTSTGKLNDKSTSVQDPRFISSEFSRPSISGMSSTLLEANAWVSSQESATNIWNHQNPYSASYEKCFQSLDCCLNDHISEKQSSRALVIRPPTIGTPTTLPDTVFSDVNCIANVAPVNKDFGCHNPSNQKEPLLPQSYGKEDCLDSSQTSLHVGIGDHVFVASCFTGKEELSNKPVTKDGLDHMSKTGMQFELPDINVPYGFTLAHDSDKGFTSVVDSLESLDHYNPAVDSPCWKGARASCFSPSDVSEAATPHHLMKKLEACNSSYFQHQIVHPYTDVTVKVSSQNLCENSVYQENGYVELGSLLCPERFSNANCPAREHSSADAVKVGFDYPKPSSNNGVQFSNEFYEPRKKYDVPNDSKSDSDLKPSHTIQPGLDKGEFRSERGFRLCPDVVDAGLNANDASEYGSVTFHGLESASCLPCTAEDVDELDKQHATESTPKMNVQMLVNTIHNLSELLLFHCSNDAFAVSEQDHEALKHVINNLDACVSKKIVHMTKTRESMVTRLGSSHECGNLPDLHKDFIAGRPQVTKEAGASSQGWFDHHCIPEAKGNGNISGKEIEKFPDLVSLRDDADSVKDDNMVQAIKEVLREAFNGEEEMQSETHFYRNLWLEAEAALCSITFRARFNRVKLEMEKFKSHKGKDVAESTKPVEKLLNSTVSPDPIITPKVNNSMVPDNSIQDFPITSTTKTKVVDDVEASILARFCILKCRDENSNSVSTVGQRLGEVDTGFAGKTNHWPFVGDQSMDGNLDVAVGPNSQHCSEVDKFGSNIGGSDHETIKEFLACTTDDQVIQSCKNQKPGSPHPSGCCASSSSDWEHVLKDEFASQN